MVNGQKNVADEATNALLKPSIWFRIMDKCTIKTTTKYNNNDAQTVKSTEPKHIRKATGFLI